MLKIWNPDVSEDFLRDQLPFAHPTSEHPYILPPDFSAQYLVLYGQECPSNRREIPITILPVYRTLECKLSHLTLLPVNTGSSRVLLRLSGKC
jgi:hypothetical protein